MANGPGKYDESARAAMAETHAETVILIVMDGRLGSGFSVVSTDPSMHLRIPAILRNIADGIDKQNAQGVEPVKKTVQEPPPGTV